MNNEARSQYVVIFHATPRSDLGPDYLAIVHSLREKAFAAYGCLDFVYATTPDGDEIAISTWPDAESVRRWKADPAHAAAQAQYARWYTRYRIQVAEVARDYASRDANG